MIWFGVLAYFWLRQELARGKVHSPKRWLVAGGAWSYLLYLLHAYGERLYWKLGWQVPALPQWFLIMTATLLVSYVFYLLVERLRTGWPARSKCAQRLQRQASPRAQRKRQRDNAPLRRISKRNATNVTWLEGICNSSRLKVFSRTNSVLSIRARTDKLL